MPNPIKRMFNLRKGETKTNEMIHNFWDTRFTKDEGISKSDFRKAEKQLDVKLPSLYLELLQIQNGGETVDLGYPTTHKNSYADTYVPFYKMSGIDFKDFATSTSVLMQTSYYQEEWDLVDNVLLLVGEGHWWIVLDYRLNKEEPQVSWITSDFDEDFVLAETFKEFISRLRPLEELDALENTNEI